MRRHYRLHMYNGLHTCSCGRCQRAGGLEDGVCVVASVCPDCESNRMKLCSYTL